MHTAPQATFVGSSAEAPVANPASLLDLQTWDHEKLYLYEEQFNGPLLNGGDNKKNQPT